MDLSSSLRDSWIAEGRIKGSKAVIIVWDMEDKEFYPIFVQPEEDSVLISKRIRLSINFQKIIEIVEI